MFRLLALGRRGIVGQLLRQLAIKLSLLTGKPVLYVCNVDEKSAATGNAWSRAVEARAATEGAGCVVVSAVESAKRWSVAASSITCLRLEVLAIPAG